MVIEHGNNTIVTLHEGRAALDPVAAVVVTHLAEFADRGAVDVAAEHGIHIIAFRIMRHSSFEFANEAHGVFHTSLGIRAKRPVTQTEATPDKINKRIEREQKLIAKIACEREPFHILHHSVEFVAVNDQDAFAGGGNVDCSLLDFDVAVGAAEIGHQLVVISRDVDHVRAFAGFAEDFLNHVVVLLRPINSATQRPDIDEVADDIERLEIVLAQKVEQSGGVAAARAQVRIGDPRGAIASRRKQFVSRFAKRKTLLSSENSVRISDSRSERSHSRSGGKVKTNPALRQKK